MTDAASAVTFDLASLLQAPGQEGNANGSQLQTTLYDVARFQELMAVNGQTASAQAATFEPATTSALHAGRVEATQSLESAGLNENNGFKKAISMLDSLNGRIEGIGQEAVNIIESDTELTPSEIISLTMKAHEFLFQSELTANIANKSSEGLQQLFRQQS